MPTDNEMLLSLVNMKLRDRYADLTELCDDLEWCEEEVVSRLRSIGYGYDGELNAFRPLVCG